MPAWAALGIKSSTSVTPCGAPGSAPFPPQPAAPASSRTAASSAAARLIQQGKLFDPQSGYTPASKPSLGTGTRGGVTSAATWTRGISRRVDRHFPAGVLHRQRGGAVRSHRQSGSVRLGLCRRRPRSRLPAAVSYTHLTL